MPRPRGFSDGVFGRGPFPYEVARHSFDRLCLVPLVRTETILGVTGTTSMCREDCGGGLWPSVSRESRVDRSSVAAPFEQSREWRASATEETAAANDDLNIRHESTFEEKSPSSLDP
jgi:hypothetical protein